MTKTTQIVLLLGWIIGGLCRPGIAQDKPVLFTGKSPGEIYKIIHQARWNLDTDTVLACTSQRASVTKEQAYNQLMLERSKRPQSIKILQVDIQDRMATVKIAGQRRDRETDQLFNSQGTVTFVQEDGTWRMRHEEWSPEVQEPAPPSERKTF